jgi:hypothetical protein
MNKYITETFNSHDGDKEKRVWERILKKCYFNLGVREDLSKEVAMSRDVKE